MYTSV